MYNIFNLHSLFYKNLDMNKRLFIILLSIIISVPVFSQGIKFEKSMDAAIAKARKENKRIFVDVATSWCGPCKIMAANTFTRKDVGDFFSKHYVCLKLDAEKGEGVKIAKKYVVKAYPTLLFLNKDGEFLYKKVGSVKSKKLIEWASMKDAPSDLYFDMKKKYKSDKMTNKEIVDYMELVRKTGLSAVEILEEYLKSLSLKDLRSKNTYTEILKNRLSTNDYAFKILLKEYKYYSKLVDKRKFDNYLLAKCLYQSYTNGRTNISNKDFWKSLEMQGFSKVDDVEETYKLVKLLSKAANSVKIIDEEKYEDYSVRLKMLVKKNPYASTLVCREGIKAASGKNKRLATLMEKILTEASELEGKSAAKVMGSFAKLTSRSTRNLVIVNKRYDMAIKWSGDPNFQKEDVLKVKRQLGLLNSQFYHKEFPGFTLPDIDGNKVSLSDFRGKFVILDFWASWCSACRGENPNLKAVYKKYVSKGLEIISITCDKKMKIGKKLLRKKEWLKLTAKNTGVYKKYGIRGIPKIMLINPKGVLVGENLFGYKIEAAIKKEMKL